VIGDAEFPATAAGYRRSGSSPPRAETSDLQTTAALVDMVIAAGLSGRRVAVQLNGYTDEAALSRLASVQRLCYDCHSIPLATAQSSRSTTPLDQSGVSTAA
jgi:hypothetical protein